MSMNLVLEKANEMLPEDKNNSHEQKYKDIIPFPYEIKNVDQKLNSQLLKDFAGEKTGYIQVGPKNWFFKCGYAQGAQDLYNFELRPDDVFVVTFPRSGTTWTQEMVWLLCNNLDYQKAAELPLYERFKYLDTSLALPKFKTEPFLKENPDYYKIIKGIFYSEWTTLSESNEQRFIKSHLPFSLLPPNLSQAGCKVIYVARNPKDVAVSLYHWCRAAKLQGYLGDFRKYWFYFKRNLQPCTPYWEHVKEGWNMRHEENVLFLFYENMNKNLRQSIEKISTFLGRSYSESELDKLENHLKFDNFKNNKSVNLDVMIKLGLRLEHEEPFIRKGKVGGWKDYFDHDMETEADEWIEENLKDTDLRFPE